MLAKQPRESSRPRRWMGPNNVGSPPPPPDQWLRFSGFRLPSRRDDSRGLQQTWPPPPLRSQMKCPRAGLCPVNGFPVQSLGTTVDFRRWSCGSSARFAALVLLARLRRRQGRDVSQPAPSSLSPPALAERTRNARVPSFLCFIASNRLGRLTAPIPIPDHQQCT